MERLKNGKIEKWKEINIAYNLSIFPYFNISILNAKHASPIWRLNFSEITTFVVKIL